MRITERFAQISDMFNLTAHDWCVLFNSPEKFPPVKRKALINRDFDATEFAQ